MQLHILLHVVWLILLLSALIYVLVFLFKHPSKKKRKGIPVAFDSVFTKQIELLKKIEKGKEVQMEAYYNLNHSILENYRMLLQMELRNLIRHTPFDKEGITELYKEYLGITKHPSTQLEEFMTDWKKTISKTAV